MTEEIKEILDKLKESVDNPIIDVPTCDGSDSEPMDNTALLKPNACKQLLDYITNLQQEINKLTAESTEWESKYYDLQQKYERLKNIRKE